MKDVQMENGQAQSVGAQVDEEGVCGCRWPRVRCQPLRRLSCGGQSAPGEVLSLGRAREKCGTNMERERSKTNSLAVDLEVLVGIHDFLAVMNRWMDGWVDGKGCKV